MTQAPTQPDAHDLPCLVGMPPSAIAALIASLDESDYRAQQVGEWLYARRTADVGAMTNLSKNLRLKLATATQPLPGQVVRVQEDHEVTTKFATRFADGSIIETVLMFEPQPSGAMRRTLCVSTQAGCAMGCRFCASGQLGLKRNLTTAEVLAQVYHAIPLLPNGEWLTNIVYMGMGEPFHNWEATVGSLEVLTAAWGFGMSPRRITISTVGMPQRILDLAAQDVPVNLAISLHAPNDDIRQMLIPTNTVYGGLVPILDAARVYFEQTKRQVTFEYTLVGGVNDHRDHAHELGKLVARRLPGSNINLIPMNPVEGSGLLVPQPEDVQTFAQVLEGYGLSTHTRKKKGRSISAACGQLRLAVESGAAKI